MNKKHYIEDYKDETWEAHLSFKNLMLGFGKLIDSGKTLAEVEASGFFDNRR